MFGLGIKETPEAADGPDSNQKGQCIPLQRRARPTYEFRPRTDSTAADKQASGRSLPYSMRQPGTIGANLVGIERFG